MPLGFYKRGLTSTITFNNMKKVKQINGSKSLSGQQQRKITGGKKYCGDGRPCPPGYACVGVACCPSLEGF